MAKKKKVKKKCCQKYKKTNKHCKKCPLSLKAKCIEKTKKKSKKKRKKEKKEKKARGLPAVDKRQGCPVTVEIIDLAFQ